mmetsp:Transcript_315/g.670  ORF Transcript_315/g.670 Transcript_315/m.670 type:complete len:268 (-) Transcript_315:79-882(-)
MPGNCVEGLGALLAPVGQRYFTLLEVGSLVNVGAKVRLAEYRRVEGSGAKTARKDKGLEELVVQKPQLPVDWQRLLAKGLKVTLLEVGQLAARGRDFFHVKADLELGRLVGIGNNVRGQCLDLRNQNGSRGHDLEEFLSVEATPVLAVGSDSHHLDVGGIQECQLVAGWRTSLSTTNEPSIIIRRLKIFVVSINDLVQIKGHLVGVRIGVSQFFSFLVVILVIGGTFSFFAVLSLTASVIVIPCQRQTKKGKAIHLGIDRIQNGRHV